MAAISGQKTVSAAGTAEVLGNQLVNGPLMVSALLGNTNPVVVGNDGSNDVTLTNGVLLAAGDFIVFDFVGNLASLWVDVTTNDEGVAWVYLNV